MVEAEMLEERIRQGLGGVSHIAVNDLTGTKDHWEAVIVSDAFARVHELRVGDTLHVLMNDKKEGLRIVGTALSPSAPRSTERRVF